jgi:hypothetical protein
MFRSVVAFGLLAVCASSAQATPLRDRVEELERRVEILERSAGSPAGPQWTCSANCGYYRSGDLRSTRVTGSGRTAAEAYADMDGNCRNHLFIQPGTDRDHTLLDPSIAEACVRE